MTFIDASRGRIAGTIGSGTRSRALLLGTGDGSATWHRLARGDKGTGFRGLVFADELHGWAMAL